MPLPTTAQEQLEVAQLQVQAGSLKATILQPSNLALQPALLAGSASAAQYSTAGELAGMPL